MKHFYARPPCKTNKINIIKMRQRMNKMSQLKMEAEVVRYDNFLIKE